MNSPVLVVVLLVAVVGHVWRALRPSDRPRATFHALFAIGSLAMAISIALGSSSTLGTWSGIVSACTFITTALFSRRLIK